MTTERTTVWRESPLNWAMLALGCILLGVIFYDGIAIVIQAWSSEEYSHAYILPFISLFIIWQKKDILQKTQLTGSWLGVFVVLVGMLGHIFGELSSLYIVVQYSFLLTLFGIGLVFVGLKGFRVIWPAFVLLIFTIPLPQFLQSALTSELQLISSKLGVAVIRLFDISVYLEGNVIDLGKIQLQVVEACSGLRYLFPLMALGFIAAYLYNVTIWKRVVLFLSTIPITIVMNSARISLVGITVEYWGKQAAEGFLHDFEGWVVFMGCTALLILEMWLLLKIGKDKKSLSEAFNLELPTANKNSAAKSRKLPLQTIPAIILLSLTALIAVKLPEREEIQPERHSFVNFPMQFDVWQGQTSKIEKLYVDALKFEDYVLANYTNQNDQKINFYVAYYGSQRKGESAHSPRTCIPGGGWQFKEFGQRKIESIQVQGKPLEVNRSVIQLGEQRQLVYYWFQQRGRFITNEYLVKWFLFWDSLTKNRSDGALVRLTTYVAPGQTIEQADQVLIDFSKLVLPTLSDYVPD